MLCVLAAEMWASTRVLGCSFIEDYIPEFQSFGKGRDCRQHISHGGLMFFRIFFRVRFTKWVKSNLCNQHSLTEINDQSHLTNIGACTPHRQHPGNIVDSLNLTSRDFHFNVNLIRTTTPHKIRALYLRCFIKALISPRRIGRHERCSTLERNC